MKEILVIAKSLPEAYHKALYHLDQQGDIVDCEHWDCKQKEISMTINILEPLKEPMISKFFIGGQKELQQYVMEMLDGILDFEIDKGNWVYTYHDRMATQIPYVIEELKKTKSSRRAVINIRKNSDLFIEDCPCMQQIQYFIRDNKLHCKVLFRSNDACKASFMNMFALIMLQKKIADSLDVEIGTYTHRANSFHCYERDFSMLKGYVDRINKFINSEEYRDLLKLAYEYEHDWKEDMEDYIPEIMEQVEELKTR